MATQVTVKSQQFFHRTAPIHHKIINSGFEKYVDLVSWMSAPPVAHVAQFKAQTQILTNILSMYVTLQ